MFSLLLFVAIFAPIPALYRRTLVIPCAFICLPCLGLLLAAISAIDKGPSASGLGDYILALASIILLFYVISLPVNIIFLWKRRSVSSAHTAIFFLTLAVPVFAVTISAIAGYALPH
jgi:hypothetical protein